MSNSARPAQAKGLWARAVAEQARVLGALLMREMVMRYGRENIGFLWLVIEPLILTTGVMVLWSYMRHAEHNVALAAFCITGYMPLTLWRHISSQTVSCMRQNLPLLYHRQIRPLDLLVARSLLEFAGTTLALVAVYAVLRLTGLLDPYDDLAKSLAGWLLMAWLAFATGLILAALSEQFDFVEKLVSPFQYLLLPISGVFFMVAWLPSPIQKLALYVPMVHCYEIFRAGMIGPSVETHYSFGYILGWCLFATFLGLLMVRRAGRELKFE